MEHRDGLSDRGVNGQRRLRSQGRFRPPQVDEGVREMHENSLVGIWTGLGNYLRFFRGACRHNLDQHVAIFPWSYNIKPVRDGFLRFLMRKGPSRFSAHEPLNYTS
jgi:hypothetical protein